MAISTYAELLASIAATVNRTDLTAIIPDFVVIAESEIAEDVRLREGVTISTIATVANQDFVALPADWLGFVYIKQAGKPLIYEPADRVRRGYQDAGTVSRYSLEGAKLLLLPTPGAVVTLDVSYYARIPALSAANANWLLTKYPQIYLYKAVSCAFRHLMDADRAEYWDGLYKQQVLKATSANVRALSSGAPLVIRSRQSARAR
jgi:hypothetical protein